MALLLFANPLTLLEQTSGVARVILGILIILSIFSWAIIFKKSVQLGGVQRKSTRFLQMFRSGGALPDPRTLRAGSSGTPLIAVYDAGYSELRAQLDGASARGGKLKNPSAVGVEMQVAAIDDRRVIKIAVLGVCSARCGA